MYIKKEAEILFRTLEENVQTYLKGYDNKLLNKAFKYAYLHHKNQKTASWDIYVIHLLKTSIKLSEVYADLPSIITWLLHDIIRDTNVTEKKIEKNFWKEVAKLVVWVTRISEIPYEEWMSAQDLDFVKKIFKIAEKDIRVFLIKICERIDIINNLEFFDDNIQKIKAQETLDIYVPLIKIFGIWKYIWNIEDICFRYLEISEYKRLEKIIAKQKDSFENKIEIFKDIITTWLFEKNIKSEVKWRIKTLYSINNKLKRKHIPLSGVYDLIALRIIVSNKVEAYIALWVVHSQFKSKKNRIKDYISSPKPNGYQSIHTTVSDEDDFIFEIQIQTQQMYKYNVFGLASHISYKGLSPNKDLYPQWMKKLLSQQKNAFSWEKFIESIKPNSLKNTIICTTPKWKEIELPKKSTVLDFAFKVHSWVWKRSVWAWVNDEYVDNLVYKLEDWDKVELELWENESNYPVRFLSFLKTTIAQKSLKNIFKNKSEAKRKSLWKHLLQDRMELVWYKPFEGMPRVIKKQVTDNFKVNSIEAFYLELGSWNIDVDKVINYVYNLQQDHQKYKTTVSLKIVFKKKNNKNVHLLFDVFHNLNIQIININYKWISAHADAHVLNLENLYELLAELSRLPNVSRVKRTFTYKIWTFLVILIFISVFIVFSPIVLFHFGGDYSISSEAYKILLYVSMWLFIFLLYYFKFIAKISLPGLIKQKAFWSWMFWLNTFILASVIWWVVNIYTQKDSIFLFSVIVLLYWLTSFEYLSYQDDEE